MAAAPPAFLSRADWLNERRVRDYSLIFLAVFVAAALWFHAGSTGLVDRRGQPVGTDFVTLYTGGVVAQQGDAAQVYDHQRFHAAQKATIGSESIPFFGWYYPPVYLLLAWPLALLPYGAALALFLGASFAALALVVWRIAPRPLALIALAAFPGVFVNLGHGQNGFLTAALLGGGLLLLRSRPVLAGLLFGLLCLKPQTALLLPLALLAGGHWRAILATGATAAALALVSLGLFGAETWRGFLAASSFTREVVLEQGGLGWEKVQSTFAAVRSLGGPVALAYAVQAVVSLAAAAAVAVVWRGAADFAVKASALVLGGLLATPYALDYDLAQLALPIAWIAALGSATGFRDGEKILLALAWLLPLIARGLAGAAGVQVTPLVLAALLALVVCRARAPDARTA